MLVALMVIMCGSTHAVQLTDNFAGRTVSQNWRASTAWTVSDGALHVGRGGETWMVWRGLVAPKSLSADVEITPEKGDVPGVWSAAGLGARLDSSNFWRLALVENATDKSLHYFELVECLGGVWQAQTQESTFLKPTGKSSAARWDYGHHYRFHLVVDATHIAGAVYEGGKLLWHEAFALPRNVPAVRSGWPAFDAVGLAATFRSFKAQAVMAQPGGTGAHKRVLVIDNNLPGADPAVARWVQAALKRAKISTSTMTATDFAEKGVSADDWDVVVLPEAQVVPLGTGLVLDDYLRGGGQLDVMSDGAPFGKQLFNDGGLWLTPAEAQAAVPANRVAVEANQALLAKLTHVSSETDHPTVTIESGGDKVGGKVVHVKLPVFNSWSTWMTTVRPGVFDAANPILMFWAKGDKSTTHVVIECVDDQGARWIGAVPISTKWKRYALGPDELPYWPDASTVKHSATDHVDPSKIVKVGFGLAKSHAPLTNGPKEFWISSISAGPELGTARPAMKWIPDLEGISPWYQTYDFPGITGLWDRYGRSVSPWQGTLRCDYARPWGAGFTGEAEKRWVPIVIASNQEGDKMYAASLTVQASGPYAGATWAYWGLPASALKAGGDSMSEEFARTIQKQMRRIWLIEAGPDQAAYMPGQPAKIGAQIMNASGEPVKVDISAGAGSVGNSAHWPFHGASLTLAPMSEKSWSEDWKPDFTGSGAASVQLSMAGKATFDTIGSSMQVLTGKPDPAADFVRVQDGQFMVGSKPWHPHGVNFWPRYVSGEHLGNWLSRANYNGELIEQDLSIAEGLGITAVSIQPPASRVDIPCLWDFLARCKAHHLRVNLFIGADPRGFDENHVRMLIEDGDLANFSTIFAYDVTWEPTWGRYDRRRQYDAEWRAWIDDQYGGLAAAEKVWGCDPPTDAKGEATGPTDAQLTKDGPWRVMVAAYRRFVDDYLDAGYGRTWRFLHSLDPHHLISNRAGYGGTGNVWTVPVMQFDPVSGGAYHDFISPEAYGMQAKAGDYKRWGFIDAYCRWAGDGRPVFWAEYGDSIYPGYSKENYDIQRGIWANVMKLVVFAGANGDAGWWWPGGYRLGEKSDFGCIEPYGKPRPSAEEIKKNAAAICDRGADTRPEKWITIDRDSDVRGLAGLWERDLPEYLADADGKTAVRVRTVGDTKTSADVPLQGVGDVTYTGTGPVKWLDAVAHSVAVEAGGKLSHPDDDMLWDQVTIDAPAGQAATLRLAMMNCGDASWTSKGAGAVRLVDTASGKVLGTLSADTARYSIGTIGAAIGNVPAAGQTRRLTLQFEAAGRCRFGQVIHLILVGR